MRTGEKTVLAAFLLAGIGLLGAGYYFFILVEPDNQEQDYLQENEKELPVRPEKKEPTPYLPPDQIEGDRGETMDENLGQDENQDQGAIRGKVLGPDKKPLPKADIHLHRLKNPGVFLLKTDVEPLFKARTNNKGGFRIAPVFSGGGYCLVVKHDRFAQMTLDNLRVKAGGDTDIGEIVLESGNTLFGLVRSEMGKPLENATILLFRSKRSLSSAKRKQVPDRKALTNEKGRYTISHVKSSSFTIRAMAKGYETKVERNRRGFANEPRIETNFTLAKEKTIKGQVFDQDSKPLAGVIINAVQVDSRLRLTSEAKTDEKGVFTLTGLSNSKYYVAASHRFHSPEAQDKVDAGSQDLVFTLHRRSGMAGQVLNPGGSPIENFWIDVVMTSAPKVAGMTKNLRKKFSHKNGRFIIDNLDPGTYVIEVMSSGYAPFNSKSITVERSVYTTDIVVNMNRGGSLSGLVYDPDGALLSKVYVSLRRNKFTPSPFVDFFGAKRESHKGAVKTDEEGYFSIENIAPGTYQLEFSHRLYPTLRKNEITVVLDANTSVPDLFMSQGATIQGYVYNDNSTPMAKAKVTVSRSDNTFRTTTTADSKGFYRITNLPPGKYNVSPRKSIGKQDNPLSSLPSISKSEIKDVEIHEGEKKKLTLVIYP